MSVRDCDGWVHQLEGQTATITGKLVISGRRVLQVDCERMVREHAATVNSDFSGRITLLVQGDLEAQHVTDEVRKYSRKLVKAQDARLAGRPHAHVVDADGLGNLLAGRPARCLELRGAGRTVEIVRESWSGLFGAELKSRLVTDHQPTELELDLSALDAGTAAHEATIEALRSHLQHQEITLLEPAPGRPRFDGGWMAREINFIAEVKSLTGVNEDQQIRLGFGQVLDYAHQLMQIAPVTPVLVLQKRPASRRWLSLANSLNVILTWAPDFDQV